MSDAVGFRVTVWKGPIPKVSYVTMTLQGDRVQRKSLDGINEQMSHLVALLAELTAQDLTRSGPGTATVGDNLAWLTVWASRVTMALSDPSTARPVGIGDYFLDDRLSRHRTRAIAHELAQHETSRSLTGQLRHEMTELVTAAAHAPAVVTFNGQSLRLIDLLRITALEMLLVCDDLALALPHHQLRLSRTALADAVRTLTQILAQRHPGRSIEVRIPPFAAVQCGMGDDPVHTRGTPPNVVETDPQTFIRLAHGRTRFDQARSAGLIAASGARSDLSAWFPLIGH